MWILTKVHLATQPGIGRHWGLLQFGALGGSLMVLFDTEA